MDCTFTVFVEDGEDPSVVCADNVTKVLPKGAAEVTLPLAEMWPASMYDNSGWPVDVLEPVSSLLLGPGRYAQRVIVADAWGRQSRCTVHVAIVDNEPPDLICPSLNNVTLPSGSETVAVTWGDSFAKDNHKVNLLSFSHNSGSQFAVGTTQVTATARDVSGNEASCQFNVSVLPLSGTVTGSHASGISASVVGGAVAGVVLAIAVVALVGLARHHHVRKKKPQNWEEVFRLMDELSGTTVPLLEPREIRRPAILIHEELGRGAFGIVCKVSGRRADASSD